MNLAIGSPIKQWDTVACSGALTTDVYNTETTSYLGQKKGGGSVTPRLQGLAGYQELQAMALNEMIPGRVQQIAFVQKYKPKVITLTAGGNDAGFESVIQACVNPNPVGEGEWTTTCSYAKNDDRKSYLSKEIERQYKSLRTLYLKLHEASGKSAKIYVFGYPQFVAVGPSNATCGTNVRLSNEEREMVQEGVSYMNSVIEAAAKSAGVKYIDVSESIEGHKLCDEGVKYSTGIVGAGNWFRDEKQESFHPTPEGHARFAHDMLEQLNWESPLDYDICPNTPELDTICPQNSPEPSTPAYFAEAIERNSQSHDLTLGTVVKGAGGAIVQTGNYIFAEDSFVNVLLYSDPVSLGTFQTDDTGALEATVTIPSSVTPGFHTIVATGTTYSGEPIELWQIIEVQGPDSSDIDEDGIPDASDQCIYIAPANQDSDLDGIDDACDPYINPTPRPVYRLRPGNPSRTYQNNPENDTYLYLERNIYAASTTGVSNDYDPDGDGYATIAATQNSTPAGRYSHLDINQNTIPNTIHISLRTPESGCVQYRPSSLDKVTETSSYRTFTQEATNTSTCRTAPLTDDLDENGQPDNTQTLYTARNGDPTKGEVATRLFLFRSTRGAEAQLGLSDYAPNNSTAPATIPPNDNADYRTNTSLLASTQSNPLLPVTYKKIHMVGNTPYVIATVNTLNLCQAYKPANTATIKQSTQSTTNLTLDLQQTLNAQLQGWCNG